MTTTNNTKNCLICGVGGQGTVLASKLIAQAAIDMGLSAKTAETIGMAQRGGSVVSHVRIGGNLSAPMIGPGEADLIIGFEPGETVRCLGYLKKGGTVIVNTGAVIPVTASLGMHYEGTEMLAFLEKLQDEGFLRLIKADGGAICEKLGSTKVLNVVLLGIAAASGVLGIGTETIAGVIRARLPEKFHEINIRALNAGTNV